SHCLYSYVPRAPPPPLVLTSLSSSVLPLSFLYALPPSTSWSPSALLLISLLSQPALTAPCLSSREAISSALRLPRERSSSAGLKGACPASPASGELPKGVARCSARIRTRSPPSPAGIVPCRAKPAIRSSSLPFRRLVLSSNFIIPSAPPVMQRAMSSRPLSGLPCAPALLLAHQHIWRATPSYSFLEYPPHTPPLPCQGEPMVLTPSLANLCFTACLSHRVEMRRRTMRERPGETWVGSEWDIQRSGCHGWVRDAAYHQPDGTGRARHGRPAVLGKRIAVLRSNNLDDPKRVRR
ncbi:hypothetical protein TCAP_06784, partial [Tolypocladium capitatum]